MIKRILGQQGGIFTPFDKRHKWRDVVDSGPGERRLSRIRAEADTALPIRADAARRLRVAPSVMTEGGAPQSWKLDRSQAYQEGKSSLRLPELRGQSTSEKMAVPCAAHRTNVFEF